ncbi:hypothetical protein PIB30_037625 [Stylosanthes scabra]|uniref:Uncharacterized protein n=1 Tax=Stylosanthes scabra TaxID=79078 RepID=A0ABU6QD87_9FABA|nr:hypothetical protein [Stylosanthes scabra]
MGRNGVKSHTVIPGFTESLQPQELSADSCHVGTAGEFIPVTWIYSSPSWDRWHPGKPKLTSRRQPWNRKMKRRMYRTYTLGLQITMNISMITLSLAHLSALTAAQDPHLLLMIIRWVYTSPLHRGSCNFQVWGWVYTAALIDEMKGKSGKKGIGWEPRAFITRYTE